MSYIIEDEIKNSDIWNTTIPVPALDIIIFTIYKWNLCVVLQKKDSTYYIPGWILRKWYSLEQNFDSILERKTWITWVYKEQLYTFGDPSRDPRWHVLSIAYYALVWTWNFLTKVDLTQVNIVKYDEIENLELAYDHKDIIKYAYQRLKWKLEYTNIAQNILQDSFRMSQLQEIYEIVLNNKIDKRNFQKKIFTLNMIAETWELDKTTNRPAKLYKFIDSELKIYEVV